jgi:hypothetical protein
MIESIPRGFQQIEPDWSHEENDVRPLLDHPLRYTSMPERHEAGVQMETTNLTAFAMWLLTFFQSICQQMNDD